MKKLIALICILAAVFLLCACGNDLTPVDGNESTATEGETIAKSDCFEIIRLTDEAGVVKYSYEIRSKDGEVMEHALCAEQPLLAQINPNLIGMRFSADRHSFSRYYDIKNAVVSDSIMNAFWDNGELVASNSYDNGHYFIVQSIFGDGYYSRTDVESSSWQLTVLAAEVSEDGKTLGVSYVNGDGSNANAEIQYVYLPLVAEEEPNT